MQKITKGNIQEIRSMLQDWVGDTNKSLGLNIRIKTCTYSNDSTGSSIKLEINGINEDGTKINADLEEFKKRCEASYHPDKLEWLDQEFQLHGESTKWKIVGFKRRNRKYPYICKNLKDGKEYKLPMIEVTRAFASIYNTDKPQTITVAADLAEFVNNINTK